MKVTQGTETSKYLEEEKKSISSSGERKGRAQPETCSGVVDIA